MTIHCSVFIRVTLMTVVPMHCLVVQQFNFIKGLWSLYCILYTPYKFSASFREVFLSWCVDASIFDLVLSLVALSLPFRSPLSFVSHVSADKYFWVASELWSRELMTCDSDVWWWCRCDTEFSVDMVVGEDFVQLSQWMIVAMLRSYFLHIVCHRIVFWLDRS